MRVPALLLLLLTAIAPDFALAGEGSAEAKAAARELAQQGIQLADAGDCSQAIEKLRRAETLFHAPSILGRLGECLVLTGKLVEGTEDLQQVVREDLGPKPPAPFVAAQDRARKVLESALPKIARLKIHVHAPIPPGLRVEVDASLVPEAMLGVSRPTDPGAHQLVATAPGYRRFVATVTMVEGASQDIEVPLERAALAPVVAPSASASTRAAPPPSPVVPPAKASSSSTMQYVSLGVAAVGLGVGTTFGVMALSKKGDLDGTCQDKSCPTGSQGDIDQMNRLATVSTVGFAVGAIGLGGLLYYSLSSSPNPSSNASSSVGVALSPTGFMIAGGF